MIDRKGLAVFFLLLAFQTPIQAMEVSLIDSPASGNSGLSRLVTDPNGVVHISWVETSEDQAALYMATLQGEQWRSRTRISEGSNWFVNWADFPAVSVNSKSKTALWLRKSSEGSYNYDVVGSFVDRDQTKWSEGFVIHKDGVSAEHGFVSMLSMAEDRTFITWLDGRNTAGSHSGHDDKSHHESGHGAGGMTLRAGIFASNGKTEQEWELDSLTCDCCQTSSALTPDGPVVVYRDRTRDEVRDIYITRLKDGAWTEPQPVYSDGWKIAGCPVNGPAVASNQDQVAVAWFVAKDEPKVSLAISDDRGETFLAPITVAEKNTNGRVSIAHLPSGRILVSWLEVNGRDAALRVALYSGAGVLLESGKVADTKSSRRSGFPVLTNLGETAYVTWTDITENKVKVARLDFSQP